MLGLWTVSYQDCNKIYVVQQNCEYTSLYPFSSSNKNVETFILALLVNEYNQLINIIKITN